MPIPNNWPTPNEPATTVKCFRVEIEDPFRPKAFFQFYLQEKVDAGNKSFAEYRPDLILSVSLANALADPELGPDITVIKNRLEQIAYTLYLRKKAELETPTP